MDAGVPAGQFHWYIYHTKESCSHPCVLLQQYSTPHTQSAAQLPFLFPF